MTTVEIKLHTEFIHSLLGIHILIHAMAEGETWLAVKKELVHTWKYMLHVHVWIERSST